MREYETLVIARPDSSEVQLNQLREKMSGVVSNHSGEVIYLRDMGLKSLAYPIAKQKKGFYICLNYAAQPTCTAEMDRQLRYDEQVLRFISLSLSEKVNVEQRRKEIEKQLQATTGGADVSVGFEEATVSSEETVSEDAGGK